MTVEEVKTEEKIENKIEKFEDGEKTFVSETSGKIGDDVIQIRKDKLIKVFKEDTHLSIFVIIAIISLFLAIKDLGVGGFVSGLFGLGFIKQIQLASLMFVFSVISAILIYYKKKNWSYAPMVLWVALMAVKIRTRNLDRLRDVTTGTWTLGPDLDPFLFLRWSKYIVENGSLYMNDVMRYVPLGYDTTRELLLHPYMMAWFHKIWIYFGSESVTHSAVWYPAIMFFLTVIFFYLFVKKLFVDRLGSNKASIIAIVASFFLSVIPVLLPRTIAGIPEKESVAFLFLFLSFWLFLTAWKAKKLGYGLLIGILAGAATAGMALVWGGYIFATLSIGLTGLIAFLLGKVDKRRLAIYGVWLITAFILMYQLPLRYSVKALLVSYPTGLPFAVLIIAAFHIFVYSPYLSKYFEKGKLGRVPGRIISGVLAVVAILIVAMVLFTPEIITSQVKNIANNLVAPSSARIQQTVAENRQPYFNEWVGSFGPHYRNIPVLFWLFFIGSIYLFYSMIKEVFAKKERLWLTTSYFILLTFTIFSRYTGASTFNGTNTISKVMYALGFLIFVFVFGKYYYIYNKKGEEDKLKGLDVGFILLFIFFFLSVVAARSAVRTIMVLAPGAAIMASYLGVALYDKATKVKDNTRKIIIWSLVLLVVIGLTFSGWQYYKTVNGQAAGYAPSPYTNQWQKAMGWVRENTAEASVFGHWWDYGYWVQSLGERATILDGGNSQGYWNHMMGRYALTGPDKREALEFLYAHEATHFLIDPTDIGKYTAFSSIGSDINWDRRSWMTVFGRSSDQIQETKNGTMYFYTGGTTLDGDVTYEFEGNKIFLPGDKAGVGGFMIELDENGNMITNPIGIYIYQNQQHRIPLRYAYINGEFVDFESGIDAGVFLFPRASENSVEQNGALIYLSSKTVKSQLARLYFYGADEDNFKLVHSEDDFIVAQIKASYPEVGDIVFFNGLRGPIKIWEINYPDDIQLKEEYLNTQPPEDSGYTL
jgi:asparagine N-glycosylation enzyme membrane subunit Stt3